MRVVYFSQDLNMHMKDLHWLLVDFWTQPSDATDFQSLKQLGLFLWTSWYYVNLLKIFY